MAKRAVEARVERRNQTGDCDENTNASESKRHEEAEELEAIPISQQPIEADDLQIANAEPVEIEAAMVEGEDVVEAEIEGEKLELEADMIRDWMTNCVQLPQSDELAELLIANGYSDAKMLSNITYDDLKMLGVSKFKDRRRIMRSLPLIQQIVAPEANQEVNATTSPTQKITVTIRQRDAENTFSVKWRSQTMISSLRQTIHLRNKRLKIAQKDIVVLYRGEELTEDNKCLGDYAMADGDEVLWYERNGNESSSMASAPSTTSTSSASDSAVGFEKRFEDLCDVVQVLQASIEALSLNVNSLMEQRSDGVEGLQEVRVWLSDTVGLPQYESHFVENGFDDLCTIKQALAKDDLKAIGIKNSRHRERIMRHVRKIKTQKN